MTSCVLRLAKCWITLNTSTSLGKLIFQEAEILHQKCPGLDMTQSLLWNSSAWTFKTQQQLPGMPLWEFHRMFCFHRKNWAPWITNGVIPLLIVWTHLEKNTEGAMPPNSWHIFLIINKPEINYSVGSNYFNTSLLLYLLVVLGGALCLLGRHSTTWAIPPALLVFMLFFK
jgi:hypothetical protein